MSAPQRAIACGLSLLCAYAVAEPALAQAEISLRFGWPADVSARVSFEAQRRRTEGGRELTRQFSGSYRMVAHATAEGHRIEVRDLQLDLGAFAGAPEASPLQQLIVEAASAYPDYVVDRNGRMLRLEGVDELLARMRTAARAVLERVTPQLRPRVEQMLAASGSRERLESRIREDWDREVGMWSGVRMEPARVYTRRGAIAIALLGNARVPNVSRYALAGRVRCHPGAARDSCVAIRTHAALDEIGAARAVDAFLAKADGRLPDSFVLERVDVRSRVELVTEPATLLPHRIEVEQVTRIESARDGVRQSAEQTDRRVTLYRYQRR